MRRKIANRKRKELRKLGCQFEKDGWNKEKFWVCKRAYFILIKFQDHKLACSGDNELETVKLALKLIKLELQSNFCTEKKLWYI